MTDLIIENRIKNALPQPLYYFVKEKIMGWEFPWSFLSNRLYSNNPVNTADEKEKNYTLHHNVFRDNQICSPFFDLTNSIALLLQNSFNLNETSIQRLRWTMNTNSSDGKKDTPHIDDDSPHKVILYYLNDSDGDTYFYSNQKDKIINSITPEKNSAIMFDGSVMHSGSKPIEYARRIVLNINLTY